MTERYWTVLGAKVAIAAIWLYVTANLVWWALENS